MSNPARQAGIGFIFITVLLSVVGFGILIPILPNLVVELENGSTSNGSYGFGWLLVTYAIMQFIGSPILGALSDRFGRRPVVLIATAGSAVDYVIMALAPNLAWMFVARAISGFTAGVMSTANAYIADVTPPEKRAQSYGLMGAAFGIGFAIGPALGGFLGAHSLRLPFWFAAGCAALNWLYGLFVLPESLRPEYRRPFSWKRANPVGGLVALERFPAVLGLVLSFFILTVAQVMLQSTWILYTGYRYGWQTLAGGLSLTFVGVATGFVQAGLVKRIVAKIGETKAVAAGFCVAIFAYLGYGLASTGWMLYAVICVGVFAGIAQPALQAYITKHIPPTEQGSVQGVFAGMASLAAIFGSLIGTRSFGWAISPTHSFHVPGIAFFEGSALSVIALLLALRSFRRDRQRALSEGLAST